MKRLATAFVRNSHPLRQIPEPDLWTFLFLRPVFKSHAVKAKEKSCIACEVESILSSP